MAESEKKTYPMISGKAWWALRQRFKRTMPATVSSTYVATALNMSEMSARNNVLPALRATGLIDEEGKPTELAVKWRDDGHYKESTEAIIKTAYPQELLDLGAENKDEVQRWFANHCRVGASAANKMSSTYLLLQEADISKTAAGGSSEPTPRSRTQKPRTAKEPKQKMDEPRADRPPAGETTKRATSAPQVHLDIQIHISPESTPEQIDAIFSSMAKHLRDLA